MQAEVLKWYQAAQDENLPPEKVADWVVEMLQPQLTGHYDPLRTGIYLATGDIGAGASINFWAEALACGLGFANPAQFPGTLASSCATHIATKLSMQGANYTLVGTTEAAMAAIQHGVSDIEAQLVDYALIVGIDASPPSRLGALLLARPIEGSGNRLLCWSREVAEGSAVVPSAAEAVMGLASALDDRSSYCFGSPYEGCVSLLP